MEEKKDKFNPLVSIVIPVYNGENYLKEAIDSALAQTYKNIEIIVVNDGSSDKTDEICKSYGKKIRYFKKENGGVSTALNLGIEKMKGEYFSWLSHDDMYSKDKIMNQIKVINKLGKKNLTVSCSYCIIDANGNYLYSYKPKSNKDGLVSGLKLLIDRGIQGCGLLVPKSVFLSRGLFNPELPTTQDYDMWFRAFNDTDIYFLNSEDVLCRSHDEQGSKVMLDKHVKECDNLWIKIMESVSQDEMIKLYGSVENFYEYLYSFLSKETLYFGATTYAREKYANVLLNNTSKLDILFEKKFGIRYPKEFISKKKTRIVFGAFGAWSDKGGLNRVVANIANNLCDYYEPVILSSGDKLEGYDVLDSVKYLNVSMVMSKCDSSIEDIVLFLTLLKTDIYISLYNCSDYFLKLLDKINETKIKTIAWNHEFYFLPYANQEFYKICKFRNDIFSKTSIVSWLTNASNIVYSQFYDNSIVLPNAVTLNDIKQDNKKSNLIVTIGRFDDPRKNLEDVIYIASELKKVNSNFSIEVIGNYNLNMLTKKGDCTLEKLIEKLKVNDVIKFTGFVSNISEKYKYAKLNIVTSSYEGFGLTLIEAAQHGVPSIAFNDSGFDDIITDNRNGFLVDRNDYEKFASLINSLLINDDLFEKFSQNSIRDVKRFDKSKIIKKWVDVIDSLNNENVEEFIKKNKKELNDVSIVKDNFRKVCQHYENVIKRISSFEKEPVANYANPSTTSNTKTENLSFARYAYRQLPLSFRKKVKSYMLESDSKIIKKLNKKIKFQ